MKNDILRLASNQGIWEALSIALIFHILKAQGKRDVSQEERERNYQNIIKNLTEKFNIVEDIKEDVKDTKKHI